MCSACLPHPCPCTTSPNRESAMVVVKSGVWCDPCIASLVAALNYGGIATIASCCGHGEQDGSIVLADGRELIVRNDARAATHPAPDRVVSGRERQEGQ